LLIAVLGNKEVAVVNFVDVERLGEALSIWLLRAYQLEKTSLAPALLGPFMRWILTFG